jgi:hypothetical protein
LQPVQILTVKRATMVLVVLVATLVVLLVMTHVLLATLVVLLVMTHVLLATPVVLLAIHVTLAIHVMLATKMIAAVKLRNPHGKTGSTLSKMMDSGPGPVLTLEPTGPAFSGSNICSL